MGDLKKQNQDSDTPDRYNFQNEVNNLILSFSIDDLITPGDTNPVGADRQPAEKNSRSFRSQWADDRPSGFLKP
ncbi:hypothetical protein OU798_04120 [Prolixibacteraceae bacterium Z1-6]|uniref:Uncharacterized protein n=1 Tax=Draconibacterium aestuarii TaxID=2998507 RepID=A0A9X3FBI5_9BACT|nr:hypothetical protein [Prolixibacteraceae bacterium Z1-6]